MTPISPHPNPLPKEREKENNIWATNANQRVLDLFQWTQRAGFIAGEDFVRKD